jgi:hypothetical protein
MCSHGGKGRVEGIQLPILGGGDGRKQESQRQGDKPHW